MSLRDFPRNFQPKVRINDPRIGVINEVRSWQGSLYFYELVD